MTWAERLRDRREKTLEVPGGLPPKPTQPSSGGFVSDPDAHSEKISEVRDRLRDIAVTESIDTAVVDELADEDVAACAGESDATLATYLLVLVRRSAMEMGVVPHGWTQIVTCRGCGPVPLWPECPSEVIACPWCAIRTRKRTPSPIADPRSAPFLTGEEADATA